LWICIILQINVLHNYADQFIRPTSRLVEWISKCTQFCRSWFKQNYIYSTNIYNSKTSTETIRVSNINSIKIFTPIASNYTYSMQLFSNNKENLSIYRFQTSQLSSHIKHISQLQNNHIITFLTGLWDMTNISFPWDTIQTVHREF